MNNTINGKYCFGSNRRWRPYLIWTFGSFPWLLQSLAMPCARQSLLLSSLHLSTAATHSLINSSLQISSSTTLYHIHVDIFMTLTQWMTHLNCWHILARTNSPQQQRERENNQNMLRIHNHILFCHKERKKYRKNTNLQRCYHVWLEIEVLY